MRTLRLAVLVGGICLVAFAAIPVAAQSGSVSSIAAALVDRNGDAVSDRLGDTITVRGVTTTRLHRSRDGLGYAVIQDASAAVRVVMRLDGPLVTGLDIGREVLVRGRIAQNRGAEEIVADSLFVVGPAPLPAPRDVLVADLLGERLAQQRVRVQGTLTARVDLDNRWSFEFRDRTGAIPVHLDDRIEEDPAARSLARGGPVGIVAILGQSTGRGRLRAGYRLVPESLNDIQLTRAASYGTVAGLGLLLFVLALLALGWWRVAIRRSVMRHTRELEAVSMDRTRAEDTLRHRTAQLATIVNMQREIAMSSLDLASLMDCIVARAQQLTHADGAHIGLIEGEAVLYTVGTGICAQRMQWRVPKEQGMTGRALSSGRVVRCEDVLEDAALAALTTTGPAWRSALSVPLLSQGKAVGVLVLLANRPYAFGDDDQYSVQALAGLAASGICNALEFDSRRILLAERTKALDAVRINEERFRALIEDASDPIFVVDASACFTYASPAQAQVMGRQASGLGGRSLLELVHPDDVETVRRHIGDLVSVANRVVAFECRVQRAHGSWRTLAVVAKNLLRHRAVRGIVLNARDVSEARQLERQLEHSQKLEAIGHLAGGVAHDFNNMLTVIGGHVEFIRCATEPDDPVASDLDVIQQAVTRGAGLTRQLLAFSRKQVLQPRPLDPGGVLQNLVPMLTSLIGEDILVAVKPSGPVGWIMADQGQLEQVIVNLAVNARDAMPRGGTMTLALAEVTVDASGTWPADVLPGAYVELSVVDSGCGMDAATRSRVFEPFFTTKAPGKGTGLGLSTVYGIVKQSGGFIVCESEPELGTTFRVLLPSVEQAHESVERVQTGAQRIGTETVLVVEDQAALRLVLTRTLSMLGYQVLEASHGGDALQLLSTERRRVDVVLTDVVMPGMNGRELADGLRLEYPDLPVILMSGYPDDDVLRQGLLDTGCTYISKPFSSDDLAVAIRAALETRLAPPGVAANPHQMETDREIVAAA
ncbi:MAG TPA: response regulator [Gemmatimonadaceae bacterium]